MCGYISDTGLHGGHRYMDGRYFPEIKWLQGWTSNHYNKWWSRQKIFDSAWYSILHVVLLRTLLNRVEMSISIYIQLERLRIISMNIISRMDHCNSLSNGAKQSHIDGLQCCQNSVASFHRTSHILKELDWNIGSVIKFCSSPTIQWMAMSLNIA